MTSTHSNQHMERDFDVNNNKVYPNVNDKFYPLVHVIIGLDGSQW